MAAGQYSLLHFFNHISAEKAFDTTPFYEFQSRTHVLTWNNQQAKL